MAEGSVILYIHGMGGGGDSRIPRILSEYFSGMKVRTYDFMPEVAQNQICSWIDELHPVLLIGESMGANHALALHQHCPEIPVILVSPALNAPAVFSVLSFLTLIPGVTPLLDHIYKPKPGDRQALHFDFKTMRSWGRVRKQALASAQTVNVHAFFGKSDHYRRSGIVSLRTWTKHFGRESYTLYDGTHFMEEEYVRSILVQKINSTLTIT